MLGESGYLIALKKPERKLAEGLFSASDCHLPSLPERISPVSFAAIQPTL
jgi:hypothetical protein